MQIKTKRTMPVMTTKMPTEKIKATWMDLREIMVVQTTYTGSATRDASMMPEMEWMTAPLLTAAS